MILSNFHILYYNIYSFSITRFLGFIAPECHYMKFYVVPLVLIAGISGAFHEEASIGTESDEKGNVSRPKCKC